MNMMQKKIMVLSQEDVAKLSIWLFNQKREEIGGIFSEARIKDLNSDQFKSDFNAILKKIEIEPIVKRPDDSEIAETFRLLLFDFAEKNSTMLDELMNNLGMDAGGFDLIEILKGIDISHILWILLILKLNFKIDSESITYCNNQKINVKKIEFGMDNNIAKEFLKKLPIFSIEK